MSQDIGMSSNLRSGFGVICFPGMLRARGWAG